MLLEAWKQIKEDDDEASFHVVVVDSGPLLEGESHAAFDCDMEKFPLTRDFARTSRQSPATDLDEPLDPLQLYPPLFACQYHPPRVARATRHGRLVLGWKPVRPGRDSGGGHAGQGEPDPRRGRVRDV